MASNRLSYLFELSQLDWSALVVQRDSGTRVAHDFQLSPQDFLKFARADLEDRGMRGYVNAISNAKRAMDCQVERIALALGFDPSSLRTQLGGKIVSSIEKNSSQSSLPFVYKFLESLGGFTPSLVDRVRALRHDVEHRFQRPSQRKATEALEIATLFAQATERILSDIFDSFSFGSGIVPDEEKIEKRFHVHMSYEQESPHAEVMLWRCPRESFPDTPSAKVLPEHPSYYYLVKLAVALGHDAPIQGIIRELVSASGAAVPVKSIKVIRYD